MHRWQVGGGWVGPENRPAVMGILNVTTDSFSDGGQYSSVDRAVARAEEMVAAGADVIDVGGESTRPGAQPVSLAAELERVLPAVEAIRRRLPVLLSVDTTKVEVARAAVAAGVAIINDVRGLADREMVELVADSDVGVVIMHIQGEPRTMQLDPRYDDVVAEVADHLAARVDLAVAAGIVRSRIAIDPGIGFGKTFDHNLTLLRHLDRLIRLGCPILVGVSRKGFLGRLTGREVGDRDASSIASALGATARGAGIVRVHDVAGTVDALKVWQAQVGWGR